MLHKFLCVCWKAAMLAINIFSGAVCACWGWIVPAPITSETTQVLGENDEPVYDEYGEFVDLRKWIVRDPASSNESVVEPAALCPECKG